jgi:16S rRNA (uracil1498-N3)-methyltransferase
MRTIRVHVAATLVTGTDLSLPAEASEHIARVLRMQVGDAVQLFNGDGRNYAATIIAAGKRDVVVTVGASEDAGNESPLPLVLVQGIARGDKMDLIVQKATELGVTAIVPVLTERSEVKLDAARAEKRLLHWRAVAVSACEQSGRAVVPEIAPALPLTTWLAGLQDDERQRLALLPGAGTRVRGLRLPAAGAWLVVGPEGGLGERDLAALEKSGFGGLQLGPRILRTETAGLAAIAALQGAFGDF